MAEGGGEEFVGGAALGVDALRTGRARTICRTLLRPRIVIEWNALIG